jgi:hypothetical protein
MAEQNWGEWTKEWAWDNRDTLSLGLTALFRWLLSPQKPTEDDPSSATTPGVLIIGPGGVGKSTLGKILSCKYDLLFDLPGAYDESIEVEHYPIPGSPGLEVLVPPGQDIRRDATWAQLLDRLTAGQFRGMILVGCYGYHNHELGHLTSYKDHRLYKGNIDEFRKAFTADRRAEELKVLREIGPKINPPAGQKFWLMSLVTKQDLWFDDRSAVNEFYCAGDYAAEINKIQSRHGSRLFRHEVALASLVISNFETGRSERLQDNTAGYDHRLHALSLRSLIEKFAALRRWEGEE